jgi:hypothetical protein
MKSLSFCSPPNGHYTRILQQDVTESAEITMDLSDLDHVYERIIRVIVKDENGREAIAFLSAKNTTRGVSFCLTTKVENHFEETKREALATFAKPVDRTKV